MSEAVVLVGTKKGLFVGRSDEARQDWEWSDPQFLMEAIYGTGIDTRGAEPRLFVSGTSEHWGPGVYYSDDLGGTWTETQGAAVRFPQELGSSVERVWQIQPGGPNDPDVIYAGTQPSALFRSGRIIQPYSVAVGSPASGGVGRGLRGTGDSFGAA
jgi:hypothetical protein